MKFFLVGKRLFTAADLSVSGTLNFLSKKLENVLGGSTKIDSKEDNVYAL